MRKIVSSDIISAGAGVFLGGAIALGGLFIAEAQNEPRDCRVVEPTTELPPVFSAKNGGVDLVVRAVGGEGDCVLDGELTLNTTRYLGMNSILVNMSEVGSTAATSGRSDEEVYLSFIAHEYGHVIDRPQNDSVASKYTEMMMYAFFDEQAADCTAGALAKLTGISVEAVQDVLGSLGNPGSYLVTQQGNLVSELTGVHGGIAQRRSAVAKGYEFYLAAEHPSAPELALACDDYYKGSTDRIADITVG